MTRPDRPTWWHDLALRQIRAASDGLNLYDSELQYTTWDGERLAALVSQRRETLAELLGLGDVAELHDRAMLTKRDLREDPDPLMSPRTDPVDYITVRTSGTTGVPTIIHHTGNYLVERVAQRLRMYDAYGVARFPRVLQISAKPGAPLLRISNPTAAGAGSVIALNVSDIAGEDAVYVRRILDDFRPELLAGQSMELLALAECVERGTIAKTFAAVALSQGDNLQPRVRAKIQEILGLRLFDTYGLQEVGQVAFECPQVPGNYHINAEALDVRVDDQTIVLTSLINHATLLVNYQTEDGAVLGAPCPCGRALPVLQQLEGRRRPLIRDQLGVGRQATRFQTIVSAALGEIWQASQPRPGVVAIRCTAMPNDAALRQMCAALEGVYGVEATVTQTKPAELLSPAGKFLRYATTL